LFSDYFFRVVLSFGRLLRLPFRRLAFSHSVQSFQKKR
jgi:hypothetical protein